jgi:hypothetical protein
MNYIKHICLALIFLQNGTNFAQVVNGDFEEWNNLNPKNWQCYSQNAPTSPYKTELPSADAFTGDSALMCHNRLVPINPPVSTVIPGYVKQTGIEITERPICLTGAFKIIQNVQDTLFVDLTLYRFATIIGAASFSATGEVSNYSVFCVTPVYTSTESPTFYDLRIGFNRFRFHSNSSEYTYLLIDAVELLRPNALPELNTTKLFSVSKNISSQTFVLTSMQDSGNDYSLRVLSLDGKLIQQTTLVNLPYQLFYSGFDDGIYLIELTEQNGSTHFLKVIK